MDSERILQAKELFLTAAGVPAVRRGTLLDERCEGDSELRAMVERLLAQTEDDEAAPPSEPRVELDDYELLAELGQGGMGVVWLAEQKSLGRKVALKLLRSGYADASMLKRFRHEAAILGQLQHPGIAQIHDVGATGDGQPFFAMEHIEGLALDVYCDRHELDRDARLELIARLADAVAHAHDKGVIHRDLKPDNILVTADGKPKILDFGIARVTESASGMSLMTMTMQTSPGQVIGTVPYMSPEQVLGDPSQIDARSDVYALGALLYELLSGRLPVDVTGRSIPEAARLIRDEEPTRLSVITEACRGDVETIVQKSLEKEKLRRYQSAAELAADIRRFLRSEPIVARPTTTLYRVKKFVRRNKGLSAGLAATFAVLLIGTIVSLALVVRANRNAARADRNAYSARLMAAAAAIEKHDIGTARRELEATTRALRGWEWQHLHSRLDMSLGVLPASDKAGQPQFRDDGGTITAWLRDKGDAVLARWSVATGRRISDGARVRGVEWGEVEMSRASSAAVSLMLTPSEILEVDELAGVRRSILRSALTGSAPGRFWNLSADGRVVSWITEPVPDERRTFHVAKLKDLPHGSSQVVGATWGLSVLSADGRRLAHSLDMSGGLSLWTEGIGTRQLRGHKNEVRGAAFSGDGSLLVTCSSDRTLRSWDATTGKAIACSMELDDALVSVLVSAGGELAASSTEQGLVHLWDARSLRLRSILRGNAPGTVGLAMSPDGTLLASTNYYASDASIRLWDTTADGDPWVLRGHESYVYGVAWSANGRWIASGAWDATVRLWDAATLEEVARFEMPGGHWKSKIMDSVCFSPDGERLVAIDAAGQLICWDVATRQQRTTMPGYGFPAGSPITFHPDGKRVLVGVRCPSPDQAGSVRVLDCDTGSASDAPFRLLSEFHSGMVSPDGSRLVVNTTDEDPSVFAYDTYWPTSSTVMYDTTSGREVLRARSNSVGKAAFGARADGSICLVFPVNKRGLGELRNAWRLHDASSGELLAERFTGDNVALSVQLSPDGTRIVTGGRDKSIAVWDAERYEELVRLRGHSSYVYRVAFSPDGTQLVSASGDGTLRVWDTKPLRHVLLARRAKRMR